MAEVLMRLCWVVLVCCAVAYAVFFVAGKMVFADSAGQYDPIPVRDDVSSSSHHLSGMVEVADTCDQLLTDVRQIAPETYQLRFQTWQDPAVPCGGGPTPRAFHVALFAPAVGQTFVATLDGAPLPVSILMQVGDSRP